MFNKNKNTKAFTLIELLVVISIIGLLSSIVLVSTKGVREKARLAKAQKFDSSIQHALGSEAVGIWRFEKGSGTIAHDESGYGNNGELKNFANPPTATSGWAIGGGAYPNTNALIFDGSNDYVEIDDSSIFNITILTITAWVNFSDNSNSFIFEKGNVNTQYSLFSHGTDIVFRTKPVGEAYDTLSTTKAKAGITNNQWHFIVGTYDGAVKRLYVDGDLKLSRDWVKIIEINHNGCSIGRFGGTIAGYYFTGQIDDVRIYDTALSAMEIQQHYAEGARKYGVARK